MENLSLHLKSVLHQRQKEIWEREHDAPRMFPTVHSKLPDPGVVRFCTFLHNAGITAGHGLEICCGKGRNTIWLQEQGFQMEGFDFCSNAVAAANAENLIRCANKRATFRLHDALSSWPFSKNYFDFIVDNFGTADIESHEGFHFVMHEATRVLKPGGFYFLQIDSPELGFFAELMEHSPGDDKNTLLFPNGKVETVLTEKDIQEWDSLFPLKINTVERFVEHDIEIYGKKIPYKYFWIVLRKLR